MSVSPQHAQELIEGAQQLGVVLSEQQKQQLLQYLAFID